MKNNLTLLYVEDDIVIRENFAEIFSKYFSNIILADNGSDALRLYTQNDIDVAILDISIPGINGLNVASEIRNTNKDIEIIMLTSYSEKEKLIQALNTQVFSYLIKPVKQKELHETLTKLTDKLYLNSIIEFAFDYSFDSQTAVLFYHKEAIKLSKNEKKLIYFLYENKHLHHSACDISRAIFEENTDIQEPCNNIVQLISRLKKKMLKSYNKKNFFIDNIYGLGYKLIV